MYSERQIQPLEVLRREALVLGLFSESNHEDGKAISGNQNKALSQTQGPPDCKILIKSEPWAGKGHPSSWLENIPKIPAHFFDRVSHKLN